MFVDIGPHTFNLDAAQVEAHLRGRKNRKLRALLPVHLYGQCADMDTLQRLAENFFPSVLVLVFITTSIVLLWHSGALARQVE
ncbi:MAG: DegT/DnrJ/EryC1/StrS family aminotransferase [Candidatus Sulfotelmatobacter sp.]